VSVQPVEEPADPAESADEARALELFRKLIELTGAEVEEPATGAEQLSFELAGRFEFAPELKQRLLQITSERERVKILADLLEGAARAVEREQEIAGRAASNGKVEPRG